LIEGKKLYASNTDGDIIKVWLAYTPGSVKKNQKQKAPNDTEEEEELDDELIQKLQEERQGKG
jgi:hypothetical protein